MADRVDAAVHAVQAADLKPIGDPVGVKPEGQQLIAADDAVLTCGESRQTCVDW